MKASLMAKLAGRWSLLALTAVLVAGLAGGAIAVGSRADRELPTEASLAVEGREGEGEGDIEGEVGVEEHGGSIERFHGDATTCPLPEGVTLEGNWTHGDYVSAWAESDETTAKTAAHSDCGKPMVAVNKGNGGGAPTDAGAKGKAKAAEKRAAAGAGAGEGEAGSSEGLEAAEAGAGNRP